MNIRVELPSYSHVFHVSLPQGGTVLDLKQAIYEQCQGKPAPDGQRLITKGRALQDNELLDAIWSMDDIKIVFVVVRPTSWTSAPPGAASARPSLESISRTPSQISTLPQPAIYGTGLPSQRPQPLSYIQYMHTNALLALQRSPLANVPSWDIAHARNWSKVVVESYGHEWPAVLDEDFPGELSTAYPPKLGVFYRSQYINGYPYMSLSPKSTEPTPLQARAIEILTYTFPLLSSTYQPIYCPTWMVAGMSQSITLSGVAGTAAGPQAGRPAPVNPQARPQLPNFPFRAFAAPFLMLCLRTLFLLYIFSPTKKPIFALLITGWLVWELWTAAQAVLAEERAAGRAPAPPAPAGAGNQENRNNNQVNGNAIPNGQPAPNGVPPNNRANQNAWGAQQAVDRLAGFHLREEDAAFEAPEGSPAARSPSLFSRIKQVVILFVLTLHPDVWNRRRRNLREREARVKRELAERRRQRPEEGDSNQNGETEGDNPNANANQNQNQQPNGPPPEAAPEVPVRRRAPWLEEYINRVERAEWIDG